MENFGLAGVGSAALHPAIRGFLRTNGCILNVEVYAGDDLVMRHDYGDDCDDEDRTLKVYLTSSLTCVVPEQPMTALFAFFVPAMFPHARHGYFVVERGADGQLVECYGYDKVGPHIIPATETRQAYSVMFHVDCMGCFKESEWCYVSPLPLEGRAMPYVHNWTV